MNCKHLRKKSKKGQYYFYCLLKKQNVSLTCYRECNSKEYKIYKPISKVTKAHSKKEKDRFSNLHLIYLNISNVARLMAI